jgi:hypothetical protein
MEFKKLEVLIRDMLSFIKEKRKNSSEELIFSLYSRPLEKAVGFSCGEKKWYINFDKAMKSPYKKFMQDTFWQKHLIKHLLEQEEMPPR